MELFVGFLTLTLLLESPVFCLGLAHRPWRERLVFWVTANVVSYPLVFFFFPYLSQPHWFREAFAEIWAPVCEIGVGWIILPHFGRRDVGTVVGANLFSWLIGKALLRWVFPFLLF